MRKKFKVADKSNQFLSKYSTNNSLNFFVVVVVAVEVFNVCFCKRNREVVKAAGIDELHINQWYSELNIQLCSGAVTKTEDSKHIYLGIVTEFRF